MAPGEGSLECWMTALTGDSLMMLVTTTRIVGVPCKFVELQPVEAVICHSCSLGMGEAQRLSGTLSLPCSRPRWYPEPQAPLSAALRNPVGALVSEPQGFTHQNLQAPHVASQLMPVCLSGLHTYLVTLYWGPGVLADYTRPLRMVR